jgi:hypothetical protein
MLSTVDTQGVAVQNDLLVRTFTQEMAVDVTSVQTVREYRSLACQLQPPARTENGFYILNSIVRWRGERRENVAGM